LTWGVAITAALPLIYILVRAFQSGPQPFAEAVFRTRSLKLLWNTVALIGGALTISVSVALAAAWLVARTELWGRRVWALLLALPIVFPSYVAAFALVAIFGPRGFMSAALSGFGLSSFPDWIYGYPGALIALSCFTYPYIYLMLIPAVRSIDPAVEESARLLGLSRRSIFFSIVVPQLKSPIYAGSLLVTLYVISDFGAVSLLRFDTLTMSVFHAYSSLFDRTVAASLATLLIGLAIVVILVNSYLRRSLRPTRVGVSRQASRRTLGRAQIPIQLALALFVLLTVVGPFAVVLGWAVQAIRVGNELGLVGAPLLRSLAVSLAAALAATLFAMPVALRSSRYPGAASRWIERLCYAGYALPGLVIALAFVFLTRQHRWLYQTATLLVVAYVVRFLPQALAAVRAALEDVAPPFEESARSLGLSPWQSWRRVTLPLIAPGIAAGAGLVFLTTMKELPATRSLRPTGFDTRATRIWAAADGGIRRER
jgi:iron(III) transport system permease protein